MNQVGLLFADSPNVKLRWVHALMREEGEEDAEFVRFVQCCLQAQWVQKTKAKADAVAPCPRAHRSFKGLYGRFEQSVAYGMRGAKRRLVQVFVGLGCEGDFSDEVAPGLGDVPSANKEVPDRAACKEKALSLGCGDAMGAERQGKSRAPSQPVRNAPQYGRSLGDFVRGIKHRKAKLKLVVECDHPKLFFPGIWRRLPFRSDYF